MSFGDDTLDPMNEKPLSRAELAQALRIAFRGYVEKNEVDDVEIFSMPMTEKAYKYFRSIMNRIADDSSLGETKT